MTDQKHTLGPLSYDGHGINGPRMYQGTLWPAARLVTFGSPELDGSVYGPLFAAAPDMLAALEGLLSLGRKDTTNSKYDTYYTEAASALARARGEA